MSDDFQSCPICGFGEFNQPPYDGFASHDPNICPCCDTKFGWDDYDKSFSELRKSWIAGGYKWANGGVAPPDDWSPKRQLERLIVDHPTDCISVPGFLLAGLEERYDEPQRHYHSWNHLESLMLEFDDLQSCWHRPEPVLWALCYHDAIYDPTRADNEELSAQLLEDEARGHLNEDDLAFAAKIIRATAKHEVPDGLSEEDRADLALFLDIDLSILGAPENEFDQYEANVRKEYAFVPDEAFRAGRARILKGFAERADIYFTEEGRVRWDSQARRNLSRSLLALQG